MKILTSVVTTGYSGYAVCNNEREVKELQANKRNQVEVLGEIFHFGRCECGNLVSALGVVDYAEKSAEVTAYLDGKITCSLHGRSSSVRCHCGKIYKTVNRRKWMQEKLSLRYRAKIESK